jgi:imidazolonepropionase-like amidohydrolase
MVFDGTGSAPHPATVVIRGDRIEAVGPDVAVPAGARVVDALGKTVLPGFFDLHTHLTSSPVNGVAADWGRNVAAYLASGVTSVNDFAEFSEMYPPMRRLLATRIPGPHVHFAARLSTPGGHGTEGGWGDAVTLTASTPEEGRARMRQALAGHPDVIKIFTDGWRYGTAPDLTSINYATLAAMVEEAHAAHVKVFTHTVTLAGAKIASRAGVDTLAHGVGDAPVDDELIAIMKQHGTYYVPTLSVFQQHDPKAKETPGHAARWKNLTSSVKRLHDAGIPVAIGTDAGMPGTFHGRATLNEMELFVAAGLTPLEALTAGTSGSARALGIEAERGRIAAGQFADIVIVDGHPEANISDIEKTFAVFRDGEQLDPAALRAAKPTDIPARRISADIDTFESIDGRTLLGTLRVNSYDAGTDHSQVLFTTVPRTPGDHALMVEALMSPKKEPFARIEFPLTPGAVEPADVSGFSGVSFQARGAGTYRLLAYKGSAHKPAALEAPFQAGDEWKTYRIPFAQLKTTPVHALAFELTGPGDSKVWLELDNLRFY